VPATHARKQCWFVDRLGLLVAGRDNISEAKKPYAHKHAHIGNLLEAVKTLQPTAIIGLSGQRGAFTGEVIDAMAQINPRPIIFALSNPTDSAECTAEQAYSGSNGQAIFASGSPFEPVKIRNQTFVPGQGNNVYIFPGVGLGVIISQSRVVTDEMFLAAARSLASQVGDADLAHGRVYPPLSRIRHVSAQIAQDVARIAYERGLATRPEPDDIAAEIRRYMYQPAYPHYA
jgi:malate dehydrogenase (oxaloacetate-decarboxylating)(NADP+)